MSRALAQLLLKGKLITQQQFDEAEEAAHSRNRLHIQTLISKRYVSETKLLYFLSQRFGLPSINLEKFEINPDVIRMVPVELVKKTQAIPIQSNGRNLVVAVWDPTNLPELQNLKFHLKMNVDAVLTSYSTFEKVLTKNYKGLANADAAIEKARKESQKEKQSKSGDDTFTMEFVETHDIDNDSAEVDAPVISLVNSVLSEAIRSGASDIHVEPYEDRFRVRLRVDGALHEILSIPMEMKRAVIARLKIMSRMDIAVTRVPQDGRIKLKAGGRDIDFRVNSLPTLFGEKIVMRILDKSGLQLDLKKLGFEAEQLKTFKKGIYSPNGMVLVTGPTGSGKTTTLYSSLMELNQVQDNLSTAEDPIEYNLDGINQVQVHREIGLTFASVLRALLRQDPDTILVGEIRDYETGEVAVQAALTGHLVLSTLHTNDAPSSIVRLMNMGIEPFLVTASVNTIVAQRLVRKLCGSCKVDDPIPETRLVEMGIKKSDAKSFRPLKGKGCAACNKTGYAGRVAIYEVLDFNSELKEMVLKGATALELQKKSVEMGMQTLRESALNKVKEGVTSMEEALSITMET